MKEPLHTPEFKCFSCKYWNHSSSETDLQVFGCDNKESDQFRTVSIRACEKYCVKITPVDSWDLYFMKFADLAAARSHCKRRKVGAVVVRDRMILATGYNGPPKGVEHCDTAGCLREQLNIPSGSNHELCCGVHAEQNVIIQAAYQGIRICYSTLYTDTFPCSICTKMIINAGIKRIVYKKDYDDPLTKRLLFQTAISLLKIE